MRMGYIVTSHPFTLDEARLVDFRKAGCDALLLTTRPFERDSLASHLRRGDALVVSRLTAIADTLDGLVDTMGTLADAGVDIIATDGSLDSTAPEGGTMVLRSLMALARAHRGYREEGGRTDRGRSTTHRRGQRGRPWALDIAAAEELVRLFDTRTYTAQALADAMGVSRGTVFQIVRRARELPHRAVLAGDMAP
jgi:DNA invertase Pin-like site-specific DNA recombinase